MIQAKIVADSKNQFGDRITTFLLTYPRIIHAEIMTHRMFSRNAASSRAVPLEKMIKSVQENPFIPIAWQKDHKGMQGNEYLELEPVNAHGYHENQTYTIDAWLSARDWAVSGVKTMNQRGEKVTKQLCNRLLEPFQWYTCLVTATEYENFFLLRCPEYSIFSENMPMTFRSRKDLLKYVKVVEADEFKNLYDDMSDLDWLAINNGQAEIHLMALAEAMWDAYNESKPKELQPGQWHIPFVEDLTNANMEYQNETKIKISTARCARTSYTVVGEEGKEYSYSKDIELHDRLLKSGHMSPFEHCARCMSEDEYEDHIKGVISARERLNGPGKDKLGWSGNFKGFIQYRKMIENTK